MLTINPTVSTSPPTPDKTDARLMEAAQKLEATFLAEMLKSAGVGEPRDMFGGGAGEEQFSSFLRQAQSEEMVKAGGIGLAEHLFDALKERMNGTV
jgi:Rod binding domain-containing protein